jgi:hypothetical protein
MASSLIETILQGGCYWKKQPDSPGHSIAIASGTAFKIAIGGPQSHEYVAGKCRDGYFVIRDGKYVGHRFHSANEAVNTVREPSSNAFLHIQFPEGDHWISADDLRRKAASQLDRAEELALEKALSTIRKHPKGKKLDDVRARRAASKMVASDPSWIEDARELLARASEPNPELDAILGISSTGLKSG